MLSPLEETLLSLMMVIIMFGMGSSLTFKDFRLALRHPQAVGVGFASQYMLMPLIAFTLSRVLNLTPEQTVGLVLVGCMPGGTTSNIFAYFSKSLLSLSIMMTICSTLAGFIMVPLLMELYTQGIDDAFRIPPDQIARLLFVLLIPTLIGMWLRRRNSNVGAVIELMGGILGAIVILFLVVTWVPRNWRLLVETGWEVYAAVILVGLIGFAFGYLFSRALRLNPQKARTVSLETGIQNGPLAALIVIMTFADETQQLILLMPVMYSLFIVINSTIATLFYRRMTRHEELARDQAKVEPA
ncbi:bile acid:sodium symporter family protein [Billgrantia desiderata]|uniref:Transporter n=1 Tax=Billgrantia desiderata TaxID=52021 RepID=A0AAW4YTJ8_9GAMM|nr:bile acid:sodium symporter [Halomonas desiderata]MCE8011885.1 transporter [Halomonas desiderata]MCE8030356.1 transporter [Halomonas desiderata]MCE8052012.1 transporter [Halomonas desiderata]NIC38564.1 transporter [Halomonas desiderata]OUE43204.1 transporter [Halomonas desiderata SP1]